VCAHCVCDMQGKNRELGTLARSLTYLNKHLLHPAITELSPEKL